jgi:hypothetical protein
MHGFTQVGRLVRLRGKLRLLTLPEPAVGLVGIGAHLAEDFGPVGGAHHLADAVRRPVVRGFAARRHQQQLVAGVQVRQHVRHHDHHPTGVSQLAQHHHHLVVERRVQTRRRLVEDQQRWAGEQFECHRGAFALSAGKLVDSGVGVLGQVEFFEDLSDDLGPVGFAGVGWQAEFGGVAQCLVHRQLAVHDIVLGDHADPAAQRRVLGMDVVPLERHRAGAGRGVAGDESGQSALAGTRSTDDGGQRSGAGGQRDVAQQLLAVVDDVLDATHF